MSDLKLIKEEINSKIADKEAFGVLVKTTFNGMPDQLVKRAIMEGMMRGFKFENFLKKDVYAIPFKDGYSLITSIDYSRKVGMRSGVVGKSAPTFEMDGDKIVSCTITIKKIVKDHIGEFSDTVYFDEYYKPPFKTAKGYEIKSLWDTKPRTMIAKVAEMHALRMACPEELSNAYIEEEYEKEAVIEIPKDDPITQEIRESIANAKDVKELEVIYKKNEGLGKEFAKLVTDRKAELQAVTKNDNANS
jgi:hypothetical protein